MVGKSKAEDSRNKMEDHYIVGVSKSSFVEKYKRLFEDEIRINRMDSFKKYKKRESKKK